MSVSLELVYFQSEFQTQGIGVRLIIGTSIPLS